MNSIENMSAVEVAFRDAYNHVLSHFPDTTRKNTIFRFVGTVTMQYSMYIAFTSDGLKSLIQDVFANNTVRDFVLKLTSSFMARLGANGNELSELTRTLAYSFCMLPSTTNKNDVNSSSDLLAIPEELKVRLPEYSDIEALLLANKWLITVSMISLYLRIELEGK